MPLTQTEYLSIAKQAIKQYGHYSMLKDDEAIGEVAGYIINADVRYNPEKGMSEKGWRMLHGRYGVLVFLSRKKRRKTTYSLEESPPPFVDNMMTNIIADEIREFINTTMSDRERQIFYDRHTDAMSLREIGRKHDSTHEEIRQTLKKIYAKVREYYEGGD